MIRQWMWVVAAGCLLGATSLAVADYFDNFDDGSVSQDPNYPNSFDPNLWDIDNPHWIKHEVVGDVFYFTVEGEAKWYRLFADAITIPFAFMGSTVNYGDVDPNTSETWWDDTSSHYILARTANSNYQEDPNDDSGIAVMIMHSDVNYWTTFWLIYEYAQSTEKPWEGAWFAYEVLNGTDSEKFQSYRVGGADPNYADPNDPNWAHYDANNPDDPNNLWNHPAYMKERIGFWMLMQFESDGVGGDPNGKFARAACWNGGKFDWNGVWMINKELNIDPNGHAWWPDWYWTEGPMGLASYKRFSDGSLLPTDVVFDHVEARTGVFTNVSHSLDLTVKNGQMGTITIDPDLLSDEVLDPNDSNYQKDADPNDPNELRRYTDGTEVVLVAEAVSGKSFKQWKIFDPNHPGDSGYAVIDTNSTLYLTMDADWEIEASFKCGSSETLMPLGLVLLALGLAVCIRRLG